MFVLLHIFLFINKKIPFYWHKYKCWNLQYTLMKDPVILPSSRIIVDRPMIQRHLLSDPVSFPSLCVCGGIYVFFTNESEREVQKLQFLSHSNQCMPNTSFLALFLMMTRMRAFTSFAHMRERERDPVLSFFWCNFCPISVIFRLSVPVQCMWKHSIKGIYVFCTDNEGIYVFCPNKKSKASHCPIFWAGQNKYNFLMALTSVSVCLSLINVKHSKRILY